MYRVLKNELKRGIFNKWTLLSFLCVAVFCIMHFMEVYDSCVFIADIGKEFGYIGVDQFHTAQKTNVGFYHNGILTAYASIQLHYLSDFTAEIFYTVVV